ncbi:MAG TPA: T9SS type A sorting domain-containing protein [Candidatus Syntrophosphaera thermopropionivorans]|nr:T9SS type A sorting domain-containing protein [Candidatus Syntrophosphaera thermopropionivorans]
MKKHLFITLLMLLSVGLVAGQTWIRYYLFDDLCPGPYDSGRSEVCNVIPAIGGGYLLQGYVEFVWGDIPAYDANVFWKLDESGDIIWRRTGGAGSPFVSMVTNGIDRYYCLKMNSGVSYLYVFDSEINMMGHYIFPAVNGFSASLYDMQYVDDGLVFAGRIGGQAVVLKTDFQFNVVWQSSTFLAFLGARSIEPYRDGWISLSSRVFTEINAVGDTLWTYYDPVNYTSFWDCTVATDDSIYLLGFFKLWRVDTTEHNLQLVAANTPGFDTDLHGSIDMLPNGNIVYTGGRSDTGTILHSYSPDGTLQWSRSYDTFGAIYFGTGSKNLLVMPDGSILFPMHHGGIVLVKTDPEGNVVTNDDPVIPGIGDQLTIWVSPNPITRADQALSVNIKGSVTNGTEAVSIEIFNIKGQSVFRETYEHHSGYGKYLVNTPSLSTGIYLCKVTSGKQTAITKFSVIK